MTQVAYDDLTPHEKDLCRKAGIINGCGPKYGWINWLVPDVIFGLHIEEDCNDHDFRYWIGCTEEDRLRADQELGDRIWKRAQEKTVAWYRRWMRPFYYAAAWTYYRAVRRLGAYSDLFYRGPQQRTREDLDALLASIDA